MEAGQHLLVRVKDTSSGEVFERQYTPVSLPWEVRGEGAPRDLATAALTAGAARRQTRQFDLWVRVYPAGKVSPALRDLRPGQVVEVKGPRGAFRYGKGSMSTNNGEAFSLVGHFTMVGGGSGVTPLFQASALLVAARLACALSGFARCAPPPAPQIMRAMVSKPGDATTAHLIYFNHDRRSIMGEEDVRALCERHPRRLRVTFVTSEPCADEDWTGRTGRASLELLRELVGGEVSAAAAEERRPSRSVAWSPLPPQAPERHAALWCGPPAFCEVVAAAVEALGFPPKLRHEF